VLFFLGRQISGGKRKPLLMVSRKKDSALRLQHQQGALGAWCCSYRQTQCTALIMKMRYVQQKWFVIFHTSSQPPLLLFPHEEIRKIDCSQIQGRWLEVTDKVQREKN
jgi:hypothetical protein